VDNHHRVVVWMGQEICTKVADQQLVGKESQTALFSGRLSLPERPHMSRSRRIAVGAAVAPAPLTAAVAFPGGAAEPDAANAAPAGTTFRCLSGRASWKYCRTLPFFISKCRNIGVRVLDSGDDRWIKVQLRKGENEENARFTTPKLTPGQAHNGRLAGVDRFKPRVHVDAQNPFSRTSMTIRLRASGC